MWDRPDEQIRDEKTSDDKTRDEWVRLAPPEIF
jgi:hypothetical protein